MNISAFILAAGLGERLLPITQYIPKPLLPILGKPVLESVLERIAALPVHDIGINLHHKKQAIKDWLEHSAYGKNISIFPEDPILGTGGALKNAEDFLKNGPFLVYNADIICDMDLKRLCEFHLSSGNIATLAIHDYPEFNRLIIDKDGFLKDIIKHPHPFPPPSRVRGFRGKRKEPTNPVAFTGIAFYQPEFLQFLPNGNSSVVDAWFNAMSAGHRIGTVDVTGCYWTDIGTPASYAKAVVDKLRNTGETVYIHPSVKECSDIDFDGFIVIEDRGYLSGQRNRPPKKIEQGRGSGSKTKPVQLRNCIVLTGNPGLFPVKNRPFENCIVGRQFKVQLAESDLYESADHHLYLIGAGGSDRKYYRIRKNGYSVVHMRCNQNDPDFRRHLEYTTFLRRYSVPVPELIDADINKKTALFEDLGDVSLFSWLRCPRSEVQVEEIYRRVLDILISIHLTASSYVHDCPLLNNRVFDYEHLRWETNYFLERFVHSFMEVHSKVLAYLEGEFHQLALTVDSFPKTIVHRDFQSQNIMITKGGIPRILDYQGARIGPPAYDVVSLLWDPYYRLEDALREKLLDYYVYKVIPQKNSPFHKKGLGGITKNEFRETLLPCRLQRHMQALGAYAYLTFTKGKKYFLKYVPEGLRLLGEDAALAKNKYPVLNDLLTELQKMQV